jgi:methenyltetrahydrofolate cyclohydrolase
MYDASHTIADFLAATASKTPAPGGGSVTALVGALSAAIGEMVLQYSVGKKGLEAYQHELKPALAELTRARELLLQLMAEDQVAYEVLTQLRKLPPDSPERKAGEPAALLACIRVPESMAATGVAILERCDRLVNFVNFHLLSDLAVCADLAMACIRCAIYNVRANMPSLDDAEDRRKAEALVGQILGRAVTLIQNVAPRIWARQEQGR